MAIGPSGCETISSTILYASLMLGLKIKVKCSTCLGVNLLSFWKPLCSLADSVDIVIQEMSILNRGRGGWRCIDDSIGDR